MDIFALFGNPIEHSKSPQIYSMFANEFGIPLTYIKIVSTINNFYIKSRDFFNSGGLGANITMPLKEYAFTLCNEVTERAASVGVVNVIQKITNDKLLGDNTDGIGLLYDLRRLGWLYPGIKVLLVGSGGAARGIVFPLLTSGCRVVITNRTFTKAQKLLNMFKTCGDLKVIHWNEISTLDVKLIINATTTGIYGYAPDLPRDIIKPSIYCYDLFYHVQDTPFVEWVKSCGAKFCADGLGMLVYQAAHAFFLWYGILPNVNYVLHKIKVGS